MVTLPKHLIMIINSRRHFIRNTALLIAAGSLPLSAKALGNLFKERKFKMSLNPGALGVSLDQFELLEAASTFGFEAIVAYPDQLAKMTREQLSTLQEEMFMRQISWGSAGLPVQFREDEQTFRKDLEQLPRLAEALSKAGALRMNTWIMPTHDTLTYRENYHQHADRLREIGRIIGHYGIDLGLEYVGPKTLMTRDKFSFIRTMKEVKELIEAIGLKNVKVQLDSFHWYCAGESAVDILTLSKDDIVTVDLNDARAGFTADEQIDNKRELPLASGVIDLKAFLGALVQIGYDGPIRAEPFNQALRDMPDKEALQATYSAMNKAFNLV